MLLSLSRRYTVAPSGDQTLALYRGLTQYTTYISALCGQHVVLLMAKQPQSNHVTPVLRSAGIFQQVKEQDRLCTCNTDAFPHCCSGKAVIVLHIGLRVHACSCVRAWGYPGAWACAWAYVLDNPACNAHAPYCEVICSPSGSPPTFSMLSHKRCDFRRKVIKHKICVLIFSTNFV